MVKNAKQLTCLLVLVSFVLPLQAKVIEATNQNGTLSFSGKHAGMAFTGVFEQWQANINLSNQEQALITAEFALSSAKTGDSTYDETLPEADWFDVAQHPIATFVSKDIKSHDNNHKVTGNLSIKGQTQHVQFLLRETDKSLTAEFTLNRLSFGIGTESDPNAEWVDKDIQLSLEIALP